jgi:hypothetical protein
MEGCDFMDNLLVGAEPDSNLTPNPVHCPVCLFHVSSAQQVVGM